MKLQAVLPQHIWNQLTKNGDADDSDDDNDGNVGTNDIRTSGTSQGRQMNQKSISNSSVTQESSGLASLLMALPKAKKQTNSGGGILGTHSTNNMEGTGATQTSKEAESSGEMTHQIQTQYRQVGSLHLQEIPLPSLLPRQVWGQHF